MQLVNTKKQPFCAVREMIQIISLITRLKETDYWKMTEWIVGKSFVQQERVVPHPCVKKLSVRRTWILIEQIAHC